MFPQLKTRPLANASPIPHPPSPVSRLKNDSPREPVEARGVRTRDAADYLSFADITSSGVHGPVRDAVIERTDATCSGVTADDAFPHEERS